MPKKRAAREVARVRFWPEIDEGPTLLGFAGYKAGMTHVFLMGDRPRSPDFGKEILRAVTVVEAPLILIYALRAYVKDQYGLRTLTEAWMRNPPKDLDRALILPENSDPDRGLKKMSEKLGKITEFRVLVATQPRQAGTPKKKPDLMEIKIDGGSIDEQFEYAKKLLGETVSVTDVFKEGQFVDVISVTKGKGFQGPVKRWGIKILPRKSRKTKRGVAAIGPWHPARVLYTVPRAGQMGYHRRTEYNKRILKIGQDGNEVSPRGGFIKYGHVRGTYILLDGSLPGPKKRLIRLRYPTRPPSDVLDTPPKITEISLRSPQG